MGLSFFLCQNCVSRCKCQKNVNLKTMFNNKKTDHQKSIFSYNVYRTNSHQPRNFRTTVTFKSSSLSSSLPKDPEVLYFNDKILKRKTKSQKVECSTQTSKTILQLAQLETEFLYPAQSGPLNLSIREHTPPLMSPDSLADSPRINVSLENCPYSVTHRLSDYTLDGSCTEQDNNYRKRDSLKSKSFTNSYHHPNYIHEPIKKRQVTKPGRIPRRSSKSLDLPDNSFIQRRSSPICYQPQNTFMSPTASSTIKSKMAEIRSANFLIPPMRRGRSTSPKPTTDKRRFEISRKIPYIDQSKSDVSSSTTLVNATRNPELIRLKELDDQNTSKSDLSVKFSDDVLSLVTHAEPSTSGVDTAISLAVNKLREPDW